MNKSLIQAAVILPELKASERDDALREMIGGLVEAGKVKDKSKGAVLRQLIKREEDGSTGMGNGVAVPHVKQADVEQIEMAVAISDAGIPFDAIDGRPVHILFAVLGPKNSAPEDHLQVLRWVSGLARNADFRRFAQSAGTEDALRDLLMEMSE